MKIVYFSLYLFEISSSFDPTKIDYCKTKCPMRKDIHSACNCQIFENHYEIVDDVVEFRKKILKQHNDKRNMIARGEERTFPSAANMMALNYDLELEYIARCYAGQFESGHDTCRSPSRYPESGQNIGGITQKDLGHNFVDEWYDQIKNLKGPRREFLRSFNVENYTSEQIEHFTEMIWASNKYLGCARVWLPKNVRNKPFLYVLICNYAGGAEYQDRALAFNMPIYKEGLPCSECPKGFRCNNLYNGTNRYDALCGEIQEVPIVKPRIANFAHKFSSDNLLLFVTIVICLMYQPKYTKRK